MERRLVAILAADVVGYSRLMEQDETDTFERLRTHRHELFEPEIARHHGRIFKLMGDGLLAEFGSVVDAVECAVVLQRALAERNAAVAEDRRIDVRIGINLGDVIIEGEDRHGDSVIIAARLQALAEPGGVLLSGTAFDHVKAKIPFDFAFVGERPIKNIAVPIRIYRLLGGAAAGRTKIALGGKRSWRWQAAVISIAAAAVLIVAAVMWPRETPCLTATLQPMTEGPSIAVLPLDNLSGDPTQRPIVDGFADDITTALTQIHDLFVIARNSAFAYRDKSCDMRRIAKELGVRNLIEGSVLRSGDTVRVNIQIIDGTTGGHFWAQTFDGSFADHLALQDKVAKSIADALSLRLTPSGEQAAARGETSVAAAYEAFLRGWDHYRRTTAQDYIQAIPYFEQAIALDQHYSRAYAALALVYARADQRRWTWILGISDIEARARATRFQLMANEHPTTLSRHVSGILALRYGAPEEAIAAFNDAIDHDPGDPWSYAYKARALVLTDRGCTEAMSTINEAIRRDPLTPSYFLFVRGVAALCLNRVDEALESLTAASKLSPDDAWTFLYLMATYVRLGRMQDAASTITRTNAINLEQGNPPLSVSWYRRNVSQEEAARTINALRLAGVPESSAAWLSDRELKLLLLGHSLHGRNADSSKEYSASFSPEGIVTMSGAWGSYSDINSSISGETYARICIGASSGRSNCAMIYRNVGGTKAKGNEFVWVDGGGVFPFSQVQ